MALCEPELPILGVFLTNMLNDLAAKGFGLRNVKFSGKQFGARRNAFEVGDRKRFWRRAPFAPIDISQIVVYYIQVVILKEGLFIYFVGDRSVLSGF